MINQILRPIFRQVFRKVFPLDITSDNLLTESGFNLLQEDGSLILL